MRFSGICCYIFQQSPGLYPGVFLSPSPMVLAFLFFAVSLRIRIFDTGPRPPTLWRSTATVSWKDANSLSSDDEPGITTFSSSGRTTPKLLLRFLPPSDLFFLNTWPAGKNILVSWVILHAYQVPLVLVIIPVSPDLSPVRPLLKAGGYAFSRFSSENFFLFPFF